MDEKQKTMKDLVQAMREVTEKVTLKSQEQKNAQTKEQKDEIRAEMSILFKQSEEIRNKITTTDVEIRGINQEIINSVAGFKEVVKNKKKIIINSFFCLFFIV